MQHIEFSNTYKFTIFFVKIGIDNYAKTSERAMMQEKIVVSLTG